MLRGPGSAIGAIRTTGGTRPARRRLEFYSNRKPSYLFVRWTKLEVPHARVHPPPPVDSAHTSDERRRKAGGTGAARRRARRGRRRPYFFIFFKLDKSVNCVLVPAILDGYGAMWRGGVI